MGRFCTVRGLGVLDTLLLKYHNLVIQTSVSNTSLSFTSVIYVLIDGLGKITESFGRLPKKTHRMTKKDILLIVSYSCTWFVTIITPLISLKCSRIQCCE